MTNLSIFTEDSSEADCREATFTPGLFKTVPFPNTVRQVPLFSPGG